MHISTVSKCEQPFVGLSLSGDSFPEVAGFDVRADAVRMFDFHLKGVSYEFHIFGIEVGMGVCAFRDGFEHIFKVVVLCNDGSAV